MFVRSALITGILLLYPVSASFAQGKGADEVDTPSPAGFVNTWHGLGSDHQSGETGTASDRHGLQDATAGKSGHAPTTGSNG